MKLRAWVWVFPVLVAIAIVPVLESTPRLAMAMPSAQPEPTSEPPINPDPQRQVTSPVFLPILDFIGPDDVCRSWIDIQNLGEDPAVAALMTFGEPGFCPPQMAGPLRVVCSPILAPGGRWTELGAGIPTGSRSGMVLRFTARRLSELGLADDLGFDGLVSDLMCETLYYGFEDDHRRQLKAYREGLDYAGLNQHLAAGRGRLVVQVLRRCPTWDGGRQATSAYRGLAFADLGSYDPSRRGFELHWPLALAGDPGSGATSRLYAQNAGLSCAWIELWMQAHGACGGPKLCRGVNLAPGETVGFEPADCVEPGWSGNAWLRSSQEIAGLAELDTPAGLATYAALPAPFGLFPAGSWRYFAPTGHRSWAPLLLADADGWQSAVHLYNPSDRRAVRLRLDFLDPSGSTRSSLVDWLCPRGSRRYALARVADLPAGWQGSLRVSAGPEPAPERSYPTLAEPQVAGLVLLQPAPRDGPAGDPRPATAEAYDGSLLAYPMQPGLGPVQDAGTGPGFPGFPPEPDLAEPFPPAPLAFPRLEAPPAGPSLAGPTILYATSAPGHADLGIYLFDANGLYEQLCVRLHARQQLRLDARALGFLPAGFQGSALVSASHWVHEPDPLGADEPPRLMGLMVGAGAIEPRATSGDSIGLDSLWVAPAAATDQLYLPPGAIDLPGYASPGAIDLPPCR